MQVVTSALGPTGTPVTTYTNGVTFQAHWQPVSATDAVKLGRQASKRLREIWVDDPEATAIALNSVLSMDGQRWIVVAEERWPGDPVLNFILEAQK